MYRELKKIMNGDLKNVDESQLFIYLRYASGDERNYNVCNIINRNLFNPNNNNNVLLTLLSLGIHKCSFIPYPKRKEKKEDKKIELLIKYLTKYKKYGRRDIQSMLPILQNAIKSREKMESFAKEYGLQNNERTLLGLKPFKFDKTKMKPKKGKSLFEM